MKTLKRARMVNTAFKYMFFKMCGYKDSRFLKREVGFLTTESVEGSALSFQSIDDIHSGDSLSLGVLGVGDSITDDIL